MLGWTFHEFGSGEKKLNQGSLRGDGANTRALCDITNGRGPELHFIAFQCIIITTILLLMLLY